MLRPLVYYAASVGLLAHFGCEVCPYIESLGRATLAVLFAAFFGVAFVLRIPIERRWVSTAAPLAQPRRQFVLDFGSFAAVGLALTLYDRLVYGFPVMSGIKALLGALTIGLFFAADSALARERQVAREVLTGRELGAGADRPFSLTRKFVIVAVGIILLLGADLVFLMLRDVQQAFEQGSSAGVQPAIVTDSAMALAFFVPLTVNLILAFARNLRLFLQYQQRALEEVSHGRLDVRVPIASSDEFATIARYTNQMIDSLKERERIRDLFGKLVSPAIGRRLLADGALTLGGSRREVVVLFSDIRNFTRRTEGASPESVVADLNRYFGRMVEIVDAHHGVVDKFIGDGLMAIFGLERPEEGATDAARAANAMLEAVEELNAQLAAPIEIGIGVHAGEVVAGTIGAPNRLEFTFIGDTVNVAARLEGLTKELRASLVVSSSVRDALRGDPATWGWRECGPQAVKGRASAVMAYSLVAAQRVRPPSQDEDGEISMTGLI